MGLFDKRSKLEKDCEKASKASLSALSSTLAALGCFKGFGTAQKADDMRLRYFYGKSPYFLKANVLTVRVDLWISEECQKITSLLDYRNINDSNPVTKELIEHFLNDLLPKFEEKRLEALKQNLQEFLKEVSETGLKSV